MSETIERELDLAADMLPVAAEVSDQQVAHDAALAAATEKLGDDIEIMRRHRQSPLAAKNYIDNAGLPIIETVAGTATATLGMEVFVYSSLSFCLIGAPSYLLTEAAVKNRYSKKGKVVIDGGHALQALFAHEALTDPETKTAIAVAVLPSAETADSNVHQKQLERLRLKEALQVVAAADADEIYIPNKVLVRTGSQLRPDTRGDRLVENLDEPSLKLPGADQAWAVLNNRDGSVQKAIEKLGKDATPMDLVLEGLRHRYPMDQRFQVGTADPRTLLPTVQGYALRAMDAQVLGSERQLVEDGSGDKYVEKVELTSSLNTLDDKYDPGIRQSAPGKYDPSSQRLSSFLDKALPTDQTVDRTMELLLETDPSYSEIELLYTALQVIRSEEDKINAAKAVDQNAIVGSLGNPEYITLSTDARDRWPILRTVVAKALLATALSAAASLYVSSSLHSLGSEPAPVAPAQPVPVSAEPNVSSQLNAQGQNGGGDVPLWAIEPHGLPPSDYFIQGLYDNYVVNSEFWSMGAKDSGPLTAVSLNSSLPSPNLPHDTVWRWLNNSDGGVELPFANGTKIGALGLYNIDGQAMPTDVEQTPSGTYELLLSEKETQQDLLLKYDLVQAETPVAHAVTPVTVSDGTFHRAAINPKLRRIAKDDGVSGLASYIFRHDIYDDRPFINSELHETDAAAVVNTINAKRRVVCNFAAGELALTMAAVHPKIDLAFTTGFHYDPTVEFLTSGEGHAWVTDHRGNIIDATPVGQQPPNDTTALNKVWQSQLPSTPNNAGNSSWIKKLGLTHDVWQGKSSVGNTDSSDANQGRRLPSPENYLIGLAGAMLLATEIKYGKATRAGRSMVRAARLQAATAELSQNNSYMALVREAYGSETSRMPEFRAETPGTQPRWDNIPNSTLQDASRWRGQTYKNLRAAKIEGVHRRSIRRTAKYVAADRRRNDRYGR